MTLTRRTTTILIVFTVLNAFLPRTGNAEDYMERLLKGASRVMVKTEGDRSQVYLPAISITPNTGLTVGVLPVWLRLHPSGKIRKIFAPSLTYNEIFGWTPTLRYFHYPSANTTLFALASKSVTANERYAVRLTDFDAFGTGGRLRLEFNQESKGAMRFFGIGSTSPESAESDYTLKKTLLFADMGLPMWGGGQIIAGWKVRRADIRAGSLDSLRDIAVNRRGAATVSGPRVGYFRDTRNFPSTPTRGTLADISANFYRKVLGSDEDFINVRAEFRGYRKHAKADAILAGRVLIERSGWGNVPFAYLVRLGGEKLLRGYGVARFVDRGIAVAGIEERISMYRLKMMGSTVDFQIAPFLEVGTVFDSLTDLNHERALWAAGVAFRGVVTPSVVGRVEFGLGAEGSSTFVGIDYPF
ncbi:MAG: hypothetical protein COB53_07265 [Elusimicrobia bacterium]|nr:MAG: hypothetical protein COB53_07265 [Elusimicrobiota bacterium]